MKKLLLFLLMLSLFPLANAQETKEMRIVGKPKKLDSGEMVARRDGNGNYCAAIQVISNMDGFSYDSYDGIIGKIDDNPGLDMVYLTGTERVLQVFKTGYKPIKIILSDYGISLKPKEVWQIEITGKSDADNMRVTLRITPADATLVIDGKPAATTATYSLAVGQHTINITKEGYQTLEKTITVDENNVFFEWKLSKQPDAALQIETIPEGATVYLDGIKLGESPVAEFYKPGTYSIRITKEGYVSIENQNLEVALPQTRKSYTLEENVGYLTINTNPGATVYFNDKIMSNPKNVKLAPQFVKIKVTFPKAEAMEQQIDLKYNEKVVLDMFYSDLQIETIPNNAMVNLNNVMVGLSPVSIFYKPGNYPIKIVKEGYINIENETLEVKLPQTKKTYALSENVGYLTVNTNQSATVYLNNEKISNTKNVKLTPQLVKIKVTMPKAEPLEQQVALKRNEKLVIEMFPTVKTGALQVAVTPFDAKIAVKGDAGEKYSAEGMKVFDSIPIGTYTIDVSADSYTTAIETVAVKHGETTKKNINLLKSSAAKKSDLGGVANAVNDDKKGFVKGKSLNKNGDFDKDGIKNKNDACPEEPGIIEFNGCPDTDNDGIPDKEDKCPTVAGPKATLGCFDTDGDGIIDKEDMCPQSAGLVTLKGCPSLDSIEMVFVKGGTFTMGCTIEQGGDCQKDENPIHQVTVSDFYIGKYEVTQKQWKDIMGSNPSYFMDCDNCPVEQVSWNDVQEFINKLNQKTGKTYRLPTEAEWEYAARGGASTGSATTLTIHGKIKINGTSEGSATTTVYSGSNNIDEVAWYDGNSGSKTHLVGSKKPNDLGIYDMSGNVFEWCSDWYGSYSSGSHTNPQGPASGSHHVVRGGYWRNLAQPCRVAYRYYHSPDYLYFDVGFRLSWMP